jgi:hypothetical protein
MNKENDDELYNIKNYTDKELFTMLDLTNPSDRELEAKILMEIDKYENIQDASAKRLKRFFDDIYKHFFEDDSEEEEEYEGTIIEGVTTMEESELIAGQGIGDRPPPPRVEGQTQGRAQESLVRTTTFEFAQSQLNPLLKETQKRVLQLDSSFRNFDLYKTSTDYLINLSEVLGNVVGLRLHSVNIPYTWYNISSNYNANYFTLNGVTPGVKDVYNFKFEVTPGSYSIPEMVTALNESVSGLVLEYPEVNFGQTGFTYNEKTSKITITLDVKNIFTETNYYLFFDTYTNPFDVTVRQQTIPGFLGFSSSVIPDKIAIPTQATADYRPQLQYVSVENTYTMNSIYSNFQFMKNATGTITGEPEKRYNPNRPITIVVEETDASGNIITPGNNYLIFVNYDGPDDYNPETSVVLNTVTVPFIDISGSYSCGTVMEAVNRALVTNVNLTQNSMFQVFDISYTNMDVPGVETTVNMYRFQLIFTFEPSVVNYTPNMKQIVLFPPEEDFDYPVWVGSNSVFMFDERAVLTQPNAISGDTAPVSTLYDITSNPVMRLICTKPVFDNSYNNYSIELTNFEYTLNDYVGIYSDIDALGNRQYMNSEINSKFKIDYPPDTTSNQYVIPNIFYDVGSNKVNMSFDMLTRFDQTDYTLDMSGCFLFLNNMIDLSSSTIDISTPTSNVFTGSTSTTIFPFTINSSNNKINVIPRPGQGNSEVGIFEIEFKIGTYPTPETLKNMVNTTFTRIAGQNDGLFMSSSVLRFIESDSNYTWTFKYLVQSQLSSFDYRVVFEDSKTDYPSNDGGTGTSWSAYLGFADTSYNILGGSIVSDNDVYVDPEKMILIDASNNRFEFSPYSNIKGLYADNNSSAITIIVPNGRYGIYQLYNQLNTIFDVTPETVGSIIYSDFESGNESAVMRLNINKSFSASDYELVFYNDAFVDLECNMVRNTPGTSGTTTWDVTIGWLMGFRTYPIYQLSPFNPLNHQYVMANQYTYDTTTGTITLTSDTTLDLHIYKNLYLILDDFTQNHLNDGLITGVRRNSNADPASYASRGTRVCNPITGEYQSSVFNAIRPGQPITEKQLYAANAITQENEVIQTTRVYSDPPYVKDMFALIPLKLSSLNHGEVFTEYGGTLQDNDRKYFGPVNITKMRIKLLNDRGDVLDLNGSNWSFSIVFEYLYNFKGV